MAYVQYASTTSFSASCVKPANIRSGYEATSARNVFAASRTRASFFSASSHSRRWIARIASAQWRMVSRERAMAASRAALLRSNASRIWSEMASSLSIAGAFFVVGAQAAEKLVGQRNRLRRQTNLAVFFFKSLEIGFQRAEEKLGVGRSHHDPLLHAGTRVV